jgi:hypothetical protein
MGNFFLFLIRILIIGVLPLSVYLLRSLRESTNGTGPLDEDLTRTGEGAEAIEWWEARRSTFNRSLLASGAVVLLVYFALLRWRVNAFTGEAFQVQPRQVLFLIVIYLIYMGIANLLYNIGVFVEQAQQPKAPSAYRHRTFQLIYWAAIAAPFVVVLWKTLSPVAR